MGWTFYNSSGEALTNFGPVVVADIETAAFDFVQMVLPGEGIYSGAAESNDGTQFAQIHFGDGENDYWDMVVRVPPLATSISSIVVEYEAESAGDVVLTFDTFHASLDATVAREIDTTDTASAYTSGNSSAEVDTFAVPSAAYNGLSGIAAGDLIGMSIFRTGGSGSDSYGATWKVHAVVFTFA